MAKKKKELKLFNGRGHGEWTKGQFYIAAKNKTEAAKLILRAIFGESANVYINDKLHVTRMVREVSEYYSEGSWGTSWVYETPTEPCLYASKGFRTQPEKII